MRSWLPGLRARVNLKARLRHTWRYSPPTILSGGFLLLIAVGTALFATPFASHQGMTFWEALFTATASITVTGMSLVDPASDLTLFGQLLVMVLFHLGGLGLMTFAVLTVMALGGRLGLKGQRVVREAMDQASPGDVMLLVRRVALLALCLEVSGAAVLATVWVPAMGWTEGLWMSFFHAASAFNNAGVSLLPDGLAPWAATPLITLAITGLFITGGLGFTVLTDLWRQRRLSKLSLHSKLTLTGTLILAVGAWLLIMAFEWTNGTTLAAVDSGSRPWLAWFVAVVPRSAGFSVVDMSSLYAPSVLLVMFLIFIGGGSNSTASGIKVSTFMVVVLATRAFLTGRRRPTAFRRTVSLDSVFRAYTVVVLSMLMVMLGCFLLVILEPEMKPMDVLFEGFSAFGTAGLSRGITEDLSKPSQAILMVLMFAGRIGPLALAFSLARPRAVKLRYVEDQVQIG